MSPGFVDLFEVPPHVRALGIYLLVFGMIMIAGGVVGFVQAKSRASLIAGAISGLLLLVAGWLVGREDHGGMVLGLLVLAALAGRFGIAFKKTPKVMPTGLILLLSIVGIALSAVALARWRG